MKRLLALLISSLGLLVACGSDGGPSQPPPPPPPPPNDSTVVLLSSAYAADWVCSACQDCNVEAGVLVSRDSLVYIPAEVRCASRRTSEYCGVSSRNRLDFRPYRAARLQFKVRKVGYTQYDFVGVDVLSNVPGTPNLTVYEERYFQTPFTTVDVSLKNVLTYGEATIRVGLRCYSISMATPCRSVRLEVYDFRIVGTRR